MQRCVAAAGGRASTLFKQLEEAEAYIAAPTAARAAQPERGWHAYLRVVAGDLERPDWPMGDGDARTATAERDELAATLAKCVVDGVGVSCTNMQQGWREETRLVVSWRERREAGRGLMRVCMRAWREVADGVLAGAAAFEQRWRREEDCALAQRLVISDTAQLKWNEVEWLAARRVLTWMRLVRAGAVHRARSQNPAWRAARAAWRERRYYHALPHASMPGERHERVATWRQRRRDQQQAATAAASEALTVASGDDNERRDGEDADGDGTRSSGDELADGQQQIAARNVAEDGQTERISSRTRRSDYVLGLANPAVSSLRQQLGGGDTRLMHARRKRGDG